jgi:ABC-type lipoprotein release transport system permease subunit
MLRYVFKELSRRKSRTATNVLIVATIAILLIMVTTFLTAYSSAIYLPFANSGSDMVLQKSHADNPNALSGMRMPFGRGTFTNNETDKIKSINHVQNISSTLIIWSFEKGKFVSVEGVESESFMTAKLASWIKEGGFINKSDIGKIVVESHFAKFYHLKIGDTFNINNNSFTIIGIIKIKEGSEIFASNIYMNLADAQALSGINSTNQIYLKVDEIANEDQAKSSIQSIDNNILVLSGNTISASLGNAARIYQRFYWIGIIITGVLAILLLFKINAVNLLERKKEIGVLQSVGWTKRDISKQITTEIMLQTLIGFFIGVIISIIAIAFFGSISISLPSNTPENIVPITMPLQMSFSQTLIYFLLLMISSFIVSFLLARRISSEKPSENLRNI